MIFFWMGTKSGVFMIVCITILLRSLVTDDVTWPKRVKVMAPKCLMLNISATLRDSDLASTDHQ